jgi:hypothetical protein
MTPPSHDTCAAWIGSDGAEAQHDGGLQPAGAAPRACCQRAPPPEALAAWGTTRRPRCHGQPVALGLALPTGPLGSAWRQSALLGLCPSPPLRRARYRDACTPRRATAAPPDAALQRARRRTQRDPLQPRPPQSPPRRARAQLVEPRRRVGGATGRLTTRLPRTRQTAVPQVRPWFPATDTALVGACLRRGPPRTAAPRARRATLAAGGRAPPVR